MQKVYSKFVKDRKKEFQIETSLWSNNDNKFIMKRSIYDEGIKHIKNMYTTYLMYENKNILCKAKLEENKIIFEYLSGQTMETFLLKAFQKKDESMIDSIINKYNEILELMCKDKDVVNGEFEEVFGNTGNDEIIGYKNLVFDLTFDNLISTDNGEGYKIIDYEWRFPFAVEKDFVKFRAAFAFWMKYSSYVVRMYNKETFYGKFIQNISRLDKYTEYNSRFVEYVYGKNGYNAIISKYKKKTIMVNDASSIELISQTMNKDTNDETYENITFKKLLEIIKNNRALYDDYEKFFKVTNKVKKTCPFGYLMSKEFSEEFSAYINDMYDTINFFKKESGDKQHIINNMTSDINVIQKCLEEKEEQLKEKEEQLKEKGEQLKEKEEQLKEKEEKMEYIKSCKAYKILLEKKVEKNFK